MLNYSFSKINSSTLFIPIMIHEEPIISIFLNAQTSAKSFVFIVAK